MKQGNATVLVIALVAALSAAPVLAGSPLKGIDVKLGKNAAGHNARHGVHPTAQTAMRPAKVKSHSNTNNN